MLTLIFANLVCANLYQKKHMNRLPPLGPGSWAFVPLCWRQICRSEIICIPLFAFLIDRPPLGNQGMHIEVDRRAGTMNIPATAKWIYVHFSNPSYATSNQFVLLNLNCNQ